MSINLSVLTIAATKPDRKPAAMLAEKGINITPVEEDEGNVDRYIISKRLAIERRTGSSFLRGIMEKTLFTSAIYLRDNGYIVIALRDMARYVDPRKFTGDPLDPIQRRIGEDE